jgi:uncharacterized membrane protein
MKSFVYYMIYAFLFLFLYISYTFEYMKNFEIFIIISVITIISNIINVLILNKKYKIKALNIKEYKYWDEAEFPNIEPMYAGLILNKTPIDINSIIATIFLLEKKGIFNIEIYGDNYFIKLNKTEKSAIDELKEYEQKLVKILFSSINDDKKIKLTEEINNIKEDYNKRIIVNDICKVETERVNRVFYKSCWEELTTLQEVSFGILLTNCMFGFLIVFASLAAGSNFIIPIIFSYIIQIVLLIYFSNKKQLYIKYVGEVNKLHGLYNYLIEYSTIKDKEIKYYKLYEKFFLYAVGLGIADKFENEFSQKNIENRFVTDIKLLMNNNYFLNK